MSLTDFPVETDMRAKAEELGRTSWTFGSQNPWEDHRFNTLVQHCLGSIDHLCRLWRKGLKEETLKHKFILTPNDPNWPTTTLQKRMQSSGR